MFTPVVSCRAVHTEVSWTGPSFADITKVMGNSSDPSQPARLLAVFRRQAPDGSLQQVLVAVTQAYPSSQHLNETFMGWTLDGMHDVHGTICYHAVGRQSRTHISLELASIAVPAPPAPIPVARQSTDLMVLPKPLRRPVAAR